MTRRAPRRRLSLTDNRRSAVWAARSICCLGLCVAAAAHAEPPTTDGAQPSPQENQEATRAFLSGKDYFESERFAEAQEQFQKAYVLTNDPALLYNLGQTYRKMGRCPEARQAYEQFLRAAPSSPLTERAQRHLVALRSSCAAAAGSARTADASATATGVFGPTEPSVSAEPAAPSAPTVSRVPPASGRTSLPAQDTNSEHGRPPALYTKGEREWRWLPWATMVSGLVAAGTAIGLEIYNQPRASRRDAEDRDLQEGPADGETDDAWLARQEANDRLSRSIDAVNIGAITTGIAGAALIAASGVMFQLIPARSSTADGSAKAPRASGVRITSCDVTSMGVTLSGAF